MVGEPEASSRSAVTDADQCDTQCPDKSGDDKANENTNGSILRQEAELENKLQRLASTHAKWHKYDGERERAIRDYDEMRDKLSRLVNKARDMENGLGIEVRWE